MIGFLKQIRFPAEDNAGSIKRSMDTIIYPYSFSHFSHETRHPVCL